MAGTYKNPFKVRQEPTQSPVIHYPKGEEPGGRAGNPAIAPLKVPKKPKPIVPPPLPPTTDPYLVGVEKNLQYLTPSQRTEVLKRQQQLAQLKTQAEARAKQLRNFVGLRSKGEQGIRTQQALLRQNGYSVTVDGKYGPQTNAALNDYYTKQTAKLSNDFSGKAAWAHPVNVRAEANAKIAPEKVKNDRSFILGYVTSQQRELRAAYAQAQQGMRDGHADADKQLHDAAAGIAGLDRLRQAAMDPVKGMDPTMLDDTARKIVKLQQDQLQEQNKHAKDGSGIKAIALETIGKTLNVLSLNLFNRGNVAFDAYFESVLHGEGPIKAAQAAIGGFTSFIRVPFTDLSLVGLIAPGGSDARKWIEATNSQEEISQLTKQGDLLSEGQALLGRITPAFEKAHPDTVIGLPSVISDIGYGKDRSAAYHYARQQQEVVSGFDFASALADIATTPFAKDPTFILGQAIEPLKEFGNVDRFVKGASKGALERFGEDGIARIARTERLSNSVTGRALMSRVTQAITNSASALELERLIPGLDHDAALAAMVAKESEDGGVSAARDVIQNAFVDGRWNPKISVVRQLTNDIGNRLGLVGDEVEKGLGFEASIGNKAVKLVDRLSAIRYVAEPKDAIASAFERDATDFTESAVKTAADAGGTTERRLWEDLVGSKVTGTDVIQRMWNAMSDIAKLNNPQLQAAMEGYLRPFLANPDLLDSVPLANYLEAIAVQDGFEQAVKKVELAAALIGGEGGAASKQFIADVDRGFLLPKSATKDAFHIAVKNVGLSLGRAPQRATRRAVESAIDKLPEETQDFFRERLDGIKGKAGLGRLAKDVDLAAGSSDLREELDRLLEQQKGRAEQYAENAPVKPGLARRIRQIPTKLVLANTDVVPPTELRFKYNTENELYHSQLRAKSAMRILDASYVPAVVKQNLVRAIEQVQTEEEFFKVAERIQRAALESRNVENADAVLGLLRERGDFKKVVKPPMRTLIDGEPSEDLQTLAQRIEKQRIYSPAEMARATRQAVLDGVEDASLSRKLEARLRVVSGKLGDFNLHFTNFKGETITLASGAKSLHRLWKFLIVTNAGMPVLGAAAGFIGTQGSIGDKLHNAGLGFAIGAAGSTRYIFRVVGLEDRLRMLLDGSFLPDVHLPGWASLQARRYGEDVTRRTLSDDIVRLGNHGTNHFDNELLTHVDPDWIALDRSHPRAVDAWYRIVNHQIHPESDPVIAILLREQAGHLGGEETVTRVVKIEPDVAPPKGGLSPVEDTRSEFQKQMDDLASQAEASGIAPVRVTNEDLLGDYADAPTRTFFRGEDAEYPNRGDNWIPEDYNKGRGEAYARNFAGEDGRVYKVELPVDEHNVPLVGELAGEHDLGWVLAGEDAKWADAADELLPNGSAATAADEATYKTVTEKVTITAREDADRQITAFLETEEGQLWQARWRGAIGGAGPKKAVERMRDFLDRYSTPELASLRVAGGVNGVPGEIEHDTLKRLLKAGAGPDQFHAQRAWRFPRSAKELFQSAGKIESKLVLTGPSNLFNRGPFFRATFYKEYDRLVMNGVDRDLAEKLADMKAANHVNGILHRFEEPSRFAAKVDIFLPFQHAREDIFRVYGKLALERPFETVRVVDYAAKLFNDGKNLGIFTKNAYTGEWEMTVPGSGRLSHSLFKMPFDATFTANIKDMLFVANGAYGVGFIPQPGGLFWSGISKLLAEAKPELFTGKYPLHDWLWGYGPQGNLLRKDTSRLWMAFTGETPPWERLSQDDWKNQHNRWQTEVAQELIYQHRRKDREAGRDVNTSWFPSQEDVDDATKRFYETWAFVGTTFPASSYPTLTGQDKYWTARNAFTVGGLLPWDPEAFLKKYPEFEPYTVRSDSKYVGPDDVASLKQFNVGGSNGLSVFDPKTGQWSNNAAGQGEDYTTEGQLGYRKYRSFSQFKDDFKFYKRQGEYFRKLTDARALQKKNPLQGEHALTNLNKQYSDVVSDQRRSYDITADLYNITWMYPKPLRAGAIRRVKNQYGLTNSDLQYFQGKANNPDFLPSAWRTARTGEEVDAEVRSKFGNTVTGGTPGGNVDDYNTAAKDGSVEKYVATLNPAEQANYWRYQKAALGYDPDLDDPSKVLRKYEYFQKQASAVYNEYPFLLNSTKKPDNWTNPFDTEVKNLTSGINTQMSTTYDQIDKVKAEMNAAVAAKNWKAYYALKDQQSNLYDIASALHDRLSDSLPDLTKYYEDMHAAAVEGAAGNAPEQEHYLHQAALDKAKAPFFVIAEERRFLNYPPAVKRAYMAKVVRSLDMPAGKMPYDVSQYVKNTTGLSKTFWAYLTPTQQAQLEANFPQYVDRWKYESEYYLNGPGSAKGATGPVPPELQWAYLQLDKYDTRKGGRPAAYGAYLRLPANITVREQFLEAHPEVRAYMNGGPFATMPPELRDQVSSVLNKYGNFNGGSGSGGFGSGGFSRGTHIKDRGLGYEGNVNVAWAKEQLFIWNRRKDQTKPPAYDLWVNMPTGVAKATFLKQHPEVQNWIKLGPMSNMPEEYQAVVRDIMTRYGEWTTQDDPLSKTITQYFATPGYARDEFLQKHPELEAYWAATDDPQQQAMADLRNQYFKIQDVAAKQAFLAAHPELQQDFIDARTKRYESFLNQVAVFMGANPEMFQQYLTRQTDIMAELLRRYAQPTLIREVGPAYVSAEPSPGTRQRQAQKPPRQRTTA
jgi:hypothetical protein